MRPISILLTALSLLFTINAISQTTTKFDAYKAEADGYFISPAVVDGGIVMTDNFASTLYLLQNGQLKELFASLGCGRYFTVSPDKKWIGFKHITDDGKQIPTLLEIATKKTIELQAPSDLCGQVSFSTTGKMAHTIGNMVHINDGIAIQKYDLGLYCNITPISPDGNFVIYNDNNDQLWRLDLTSGSKIQVTDNQNGYLYPQWSPDGSKLLYSTLQGELYVWDIAVNNTYQIGTGGGAGWSPDSKYLLYQKTELGDLEFLGSDIFISKFDGSETVNLTSTSHTYEMNPVFLNSNEIIFHTYNQREFFKSALGGQNKNITATHKIFSYTGTMPIKTYNLSGVNQKSNKALTRIPGTVPYVNQVYDTPTWHAGWGSCAPTTCIMAIAYFNRLPRWPTEVDHGYSWDPHNNDYGSYVADRYRFREIYYEEIADAYGTTAYGGYGYMWTGSYSPNSRMRQYIENHGLVSNQLWTSGCTYANTTGEIDLGYPHPICNYLTSSGHLTLAIGYVQNQHTLIFNDPYGNKNLGTYPNHTGEDAYYDWPGYNNGYCNLDAAGTHGGVAWTTKARGSQPVYNDTIIDDNYYDHGFYMFNQPPSHQRYFRSQLTGYNGHLWWTGSMASGGDVCYVTWAPNLSEASDYEVLAYIPGNYATAQGAKYHIYYDGGDTEVIIDQSIYSDEWVSLGTYSFAAGQTGHVYLGDETGIDGQNLAFDAVKWHRIAATVQTTASNISCFGASNGAASATTTSGLPPYTWQWSTVPVQTTQTATGLPAGVYSVTITDAASSTFTGSATITEPALLTLSASGHHPSFAGGNDGYVATTATGGTPVYSYLWSPNVSTSSAANNLVAGTYLVTVTDANGCTATGSATLNDPTCDMPAGLTITSVTATSAQISWNTSGSAVAYLLQYKKTADSEWENITITSNSYNLTGLAAGTGYDVQVAAICTDTSEFAAETFTTLAISNTTVTACFGKFTDSGGDNAPYTHNENYTFTIAPPVAAKISVNFTEFNVEADYDTLWVYDGPSVLSPLIGTYTGSYLPFSVVSSGGSLTFRFWSDYATVTAGWVASWTSYGGDCEPLPETSVYPPADDWQTGDFTASFYDADNSGTGLNYLFYQVQDYNGTEWRANNQLGFFNDNFEASLNSEWDGSMSGTWSINSGALYQSDTANTNTNIFAALEQDSNSVYLYSFRFKITNQTATSRLGMYIFCGDPALSERYDSYLIWFKTYLNEFHFWKNINSTDNKVTSTRIGCNENIWYDVKVIYDPALGSLSAYIDNVLISVYNDPAPIKSGGYISLRTYNCAAMFDDIRVFKLRSSDALVGVGATGNEVRSQNPDPYTPACKISSVNIDNINHFSTDNNLEINIDWTPPADIAVVNDGPGADIDTTNSSSQLSANWAASSDPHSDIAAYWYAIGSLPGDSDILDWMNNGTATAITASGLMSLVNGQHYYFSVKAQNYAGLFSNVTTSDGQLAILLPTIVFDADQRNICPGDTVTFINNTENALSYQWTFDSGNPAASSAAAPVVAYNTPGSHSVTLIATSPGGADTLVQTGFITVYPLTAAAFTMNDDTLHLPTAIATFSNNSTGATSYSWNFGDGAATTDQNPYHIYTTQGDYQVTLIAYSAHCDNDTTTDTLHVVLPDAVSELFSSSAMVIYPNPFSSFATLQFPNTDNSAYKLVVTDVAGKTVREIVNITGNRVVIDRETLPGGFYLVELIGSSNFYGSMVIQK